MNDKKSLWVLAIITIISLIIRFWRIVDLPFPADGDGVAFGYYGWSLLHFGTDEYGKFLPANFPSIGDFKYPGLAYLNTFPAFFFGLSDLTARFWSAISGVILVPIIFLLSSLLFNRTKAAIASALFVALSPWSIAESRLGFENHPAFVTTTIAITLLLLHMGYLRDNSLLHKVTILIRIEKSKYTKIVAFALLILSTFTYGGQRLFIPLFLGMLFMFSLGKESPFYKFRKTLISFFVVITAMVGITLSLPTNRGRASEEIWHSFSSEELGRLEQLYVGAGTSPIRIPPRATWFFHNKHRIAVTNFLDRYTDHFSPSFLFFRGEASSERVPDMGVLLFADILLLPLGLLFLGRQSRAAMVITFGWLLLAPVASSLTSGGAHMHRASAMIPPLALISGLGLEGLFLICKGLVRKLVQVLSAVAIIGSFAFFLNQYFVQKPVDRPWYKQQVNKLMSQKVLGYLGDYESVAIGDNDYIYFLFYGKASPSEFLADAAIKPLDINDPWERVERYKNIHFKMPFDCPKGGKLKVLYVCTGGNVPVNSKVVDVIYYLDGIPAYTLIEFYPLSQMSSPLPNLPKNLHYMVDVEKRSDFPDGIIPHDYPSLW